MEIGVSEKSGELLKQVAEYLDVKEMGDRRGRR